MKVVYFILILLMMGFIIFLAWNDWSNHKPTNSMSFAEFNAQLSHAEHCWQPQIDSLSVLINDCRASEPDLKGKAWMDNEMYERDLIIQKMRYETMKIDSINAFEKQFFK